MKLMNFIVIGVVFILMISCNAKNTNTSEDTEASEKEMFISFDTSASQLKPLQDLIVKEAGPPDNYLPLGDDQFLVTVSDAPNASQGLYFVDMKRNQTEKILGGSASAPALVTHLGKPLWLLLRSGGLSHGIMFEEYSVLYLNRTPSNNELLKPQVLVIAEEDGEGGLCGGDPDRAKDIGLKIASRIKSPVIKDFNGDGFEDILFSITEIDCTNGKKKDYTKTYLFYQDGFKEKP